MKSKKETPSVGTPNPPMPAGDASLPMNDPSMNQMGGEMPPMPNDNMGGAPMDDPNMGGMPPMNEPNSQQEVGSKEKKDIQKEIGKACQQFRTLPDGEEKEQLGDWIEGMLDSLDSNEGGEDNSPENMMEEFKFSKKQLEEVYACCNKLKKQIKNGKTC